jgi:hypothetical protein
MAGIVSGAILFWVTIYRHPPAICDQILQQRPNLSLVGISEAVCPQISQITQITLGKRVGFQQE